MCTVYLCVSHYVYVYMYSWICVYVWVVPYTSIHRALIGYVRLGYLSRHDTCTEDPLVLNYTLPTLVWVCKSPTHIHTRTHMRIHLQSLANYKFTTSAVLYIATVTFFSVVISHWFIPLPLSFPSPSTVKTDVKMETE